MLKHRLMVIFSLLAFFSMMAGNANAKNTQSYNWKVLGCQKVDFRLDRDVFRVKQNMGLFRAIRLKVNGNRIHLLDLDVTYGNGKRQDIAVRSAIRDGGRTRALDLRGDRDRAIRSVKLVYKSQPNFRGKATLCVEGLAPPVVKKWQLLGCKSVGFFVDRDIIKVKQRKEQFTAIRLHVSDNTVNILDVDVKFENGRSQDIKVRAIIPDGGRTRKIDLVGTTRNIHSIKLVYASKPNFKGRATVCVEGFH